MECQVSIIVPIYNVERYLKQCLSSLVNQTLANIEIIVVNDGSSDHSQQIIDSFVQKYATTVKAYFKENGGLSDARNFGIGKATGRYIGFVDGDDFVDPNMFSLLYEKTLLGEDAVICDYYEFENASKNRTIRKCTPNNMEKANIGDYPQLLCICSAGAWNKLFKRELFHGNLFPKGQNYEDSAIIYNILTKCKKIGFVERPLYYYRINRLGSLTNVFSENAFDIFKSCDSIIDFYKKEELFLKCICEVEYICTSNVHNVIVFSKTTWDFKLRWKFVKQSFAYLNDHFPNWKKNKYFIANNNKTQTKCLTPFYHFIKNKYMLYQITLMFYSVVKGKQKNKFRLTE